MENLLLFVDSAYALRVFDAIERPSCRVGEGGRLADLAESSNIRIQPQILTNDPGLFKDFTTKNLILGSRDSDRLKSLSYQWIQESYALYHIRRATHSSYTSFLHNPYFAVWNFLRFSDREIRIAGLRPVFGIHERYPSGAAVMLKSCITKLAFRGGNFRFSRLFMMK